MPRVSSPRKRTAPSLHRLLKGELRVRKEPRARPGVHQHNEYVAGAELFRFRYFALVQEMKAFDARLDCNSDNCPWEKNLSMSSNRCLVLLTCYFVPLPAGF